MMFQVTDETHAGQARRHAAIHAERMNLGECDRGALAIVVNEIVSNMVKHAGSGTMVVESIVSNGQGGVRLLGLDKGPGIRDIAAAMSDGHSTAGTAGNGLGAIRRLSHDFDIYSQPGLGTAVVADFWCHRKPETDHSPIEVSVLSVPVKGEEVCGDGWGVKKMPTSTIFMVVDGLGHGPLASEAAREAERVFAEAQTNSPTRILQDSHDCLKKTRGAAMGVVSLDVERGVASFAGVGNIAASIVGPEGSRGMASHNGTVGHQIYKIQEFSFPWTSDQLLIMHSDGINTRWDLKPFPGIWMKHTALIAGLLYRDFMRERDDATVLVARIRPEGSAP
jgi:anti-sigma regulatory factor (Ser/Thr protein kinase)